MNKSFTDFSQEMTELLNRMYFRKDANAAARFHSLGMEALGAGVVRVPVSTGGARLIEASDKCAVAFRSIADGLSAGDRA